MPMTARLHEPMHGLSYWALRDREPDSLCLGSRKNRCGYSIRRGDHRRIVAAVFANHDSQSVSALENVPVEVEEAPLASVQAESARSSV